MTLLTKVAHDTVNDLCERYIAYGKSRGSAAIEAVYRAVMDDLSAWPQTPAEKKEILQRIGDKLTAAGLN